MSSEAKGHDQDRPLEDLPTAELLKQVVGRSADLVKKEVALAKNELRAEKAREIEAGAGAGVAAACGFCGLQLLIVAAVSAIAQRLPLWASALLVGAPFIVAGIVVGAWAWSRRVVRPLARTQQTLKEDVQWIEKRVS